MLSEAQREEICFVWNLKYFKKSRILKWEDTKHWGQIISVKNPSRLADLLAMKISVLISKLDITKLPHRVIVKLIIALGEVSSIVLGHMEHFFLCWNQETFYTCIVQ